MKIQEILNEEIEEATDVSQFLDPDQSPGETMHYIMKLMDMLDGAKRGLSVVNKLKNREEKLWHLHNVFNNLNKIRGAIAKVSKMI